MSTVVNDLLAMRELLSVPERWTTGFLARDARRRYVYPTDDDAVCWCMIGAELKVTNSVWNDRSEGLHRALRAAIPESAPAGAVGHYNDSVTHDEMLAFLDRAIERERAAS